MRARKIIATLAITIMAGTHAASMVINQYHQEHYHAPPLQKTAQTEYWGEGPRYFPRRDGPPPWERQWQGPYREPNAGIYDPEFRDPMDEDLNRFRRRRQYNRVQPFHPY